jgi:hypothetical protein
LAAVIAAFSEPASPVAPEDAAMNVAAGAAAGHSASAPATASTSHPILIARPPQGHLVVPDPAWIGRASGARSSD